MATTNMQKYTVVHPKLYLMVKGTKSSALKLVPSGREVELTDKAADTLLEQGKIVEVKEKRTIKTGG